MSLSGAAVGRPLALALTLTFACVSQERRTPTDGDYPGVLRAPEALGRDVLWRQRVTAAWGEGERRGFEAVVQQSGDALTILGLSPAGSMGFAIVWRGTAIELQNRMPEGFPFPPRFVLLDVQRAFYPWCRPERAPQDGAREQSVDGELVRETWRAGRLLERTFERLDGRPAGTIVVRYHWGRLDWTVPARVVLENGWFGYRLEVETHEETVLGGGVERTDEARADGARTTG
jgi:hypothetical protein